MTIIMVGNKNGKVQTIWGHVTVAVKAVEEEVAL